VAKYPLLVAHNRFVFDYMIVIAEMERRAVAFMYSICILPILVKSEEKNAFSYYTKKEASNLGNYTQNIFQGKITMYIGLLEMFLQWRNYL